MPKGVDMLIEAKASNLLALASNLLAMASNLLAMPLCEQMCFPRMSSSFVPTSLGLCRGAFGGPGLLLSHARVHAAPPTQ